MAESTHLVKLEPSLLEGGALFQIYYLPQLPIPWHLVGAQPKTRNIDDYISVSAEEAAAAFPEIQVLLEAPPDRAVLLQKGRVSGQWVDFILKN